MTQHEKSSISAGEDTPIRVCRECEKLSNIVNVAHLPAFQPMILGLMRELEEKSTIVLPALLEKCEIPTFLKEKRYADFTKSFDTGLKDIVDGIANVTNANQGRIYPPCTSSSGAILAGKWVCGDFLDIRQRGGLGCWRVRQRLRMV